MNKYVQKVLGELKAKQPWEKKPSSPGKKNSSKRRKKFFRL